MGLLKKKKEQYTESKEEPAKAKMEAEKPVENPVEKPEDNRLSIGDINRNEALLLSELQLIRNAVEAHIEDFQDFKRWLNEEVKG